MQCNCYSTTTAKGDRTLAIVNTNMMVVAEARLHAHMPPILVIGMSRFMQEAEHPARGMEKESLAQSGCPGRIPSLAMSVLRLGTLAPRWIPLQQRPECLLQSHVTSFFCGDLAGRISSCACAKLLAV
mmetsp:Transcript_20631/g.46372  ORF Transcript_20631/g.46372 Transcript_20631/m.46372 type:complete len:128 (+) Transcript_20631:159-542(+)